MGLEDLKKKLASKDQDFSERETRAELPKPVRDMNAQSDWQHKKEDKGESKLNKSILWWGLGVGLLLITLVIGAVVIVNGGISIGSDATKFLELSVQGGEDVISGEKVIWKVAYRNNNSVALEDSILIFEFPENAQPHTGGFSNAGLNRQQFNIGRIEVGERAEESFSAILFGAKGEILTGIVSLEFRPEGSSVRLEKKVEYNSSVVESLLGLSLSVPKELKAAQDTELLLRVTSSSDVPFSGLWAQLEFPDAFEFISSDPQPTRNNNTWNIGDIAAGDEIEIKIRGRVKETVARQSIRAKVGLFDRITDNFAVFTSSTESFEIAPAFLAVSLETARGQIEPGVTVAGDELIMRVHWKNNLPTPVANATVEVKFEGDAIDLQSIKSTRGEFSSKSNSLKWVSGRISELGVVDPGEEGDFEFSVKSKEALVGENFVITITGNMYANEPPEGYEGVDISSTTKEEYRIASRVVFAQKVFFNDSRLENTGPLPPKVGEETTYLIVWSITNTVNDINNPLARATLPTYIDWKNVVLPNSSGFSFDQVTRELTWSPGLVRAGVGHTTRAQEIAFQIGLIPSIPQIGSSPQLVSGASFVGEDSFTGTKISQGTQELSTILKFDIDAAQISPNVQE